MDSGQITEELKDVEMTTVQRIANELLSTERTYVKKLYLIDQVMAYLTDRVMFLLDLPGNVYT